MRAVRPGSINDATQKAFEAAGGLEAVSNDIGLAVSTLSRATSDEEDRPGGIGVKYLHRLGRIVPDSAIPIAMHFADLAGGIYHPLPHHGALLQDLNVLMKEFSEVLNSHAEAHSERSKNPSDFTQSEARKQLKEVDDLILAAVQYRAGLLSKVKK